MSLLLVLVVVFTNTALITLVGCMLGIGPAALWPLLSLLAHFVLYLWGDKICLALSRARKSHETLALKEKLQNCTYRLGLPGVEVFISRRLPDNVYLFQSALGPASIVVGVNALGHLREDELLALINVGLLMVKTGDVKFRNFLAVAQLPLSCAARLEQALAGRPRLLAMPLKLMAVVMDVYALPINALYETYVRRMTRSNSHEQLAARIFEQVASLSAAKQKIAALGEEHRSSNWMALVERLALVRKPVSTLAGMVFARSAPSNGSVGA